MDGLSIAGSLVAVAAAGYHISVKLTTLATQIDTASERISSIGSDISLTSSVLQQLGELMNQHGTDDGMSIFSQSSLETTRISATMCQNIFKELEQAVQSASEQIRGKGKLVGEKIKLSKVEKLKWPFLQPKIDIFRKELQNAKGTLMLMLQVASLFFSKKIAELHHSTSATLIEQRDIVHAILTLQTEQQRERDNKTDPENTSPSNTPPLASAIPTPGESEKDETEARPFLEIFLLKPMVRDVGEVVELSWHVRKLSISQSQISAQLAMDRGGSLPVSEIYESLYDHEHKAINGEIENSTSPAALLSLKRRYMNLRHREMIFYGVLSLRFIIRRGRVSPMDMETNSVRLDCMPTQSRGAETTESEHEKAAGYGTGYRAPSPVASFRTTEHLAGDGIGYGSMRKRGRPPRARPRNIPMFNDTEEHIPNSLTSFNQEGSMRWSSFGRECVSVGEVPVERRPSLFPGEPANAPQDEMGNGTEDKSPDEADVQRIVEQLLSKYTTIFEKGLVP